ncbi:MAG: leucyl aminopeptidase family protein [Phycisphaeraceae bacterium]|nr:leucyl aminopeptidase family protein [Phycisphaeraceae bacterium]
MYRQIRSNRSPRAVRVLPVVQGGRPISLAIPSLDQAVAHGLRQTPFRGEMGETRLIDGRIILAGLGPAEQVNVATWRRAAAAVLRCAFSNRLSALRWIDPAAVSDRLSAPDAAAVIAAAVNLANFDFSDFRSKVAAVRQDPPLDLDLAIDGDKKITDALRDSLLVGKSVDIARRLAATPPNVANPAYMARFCRDLARKTTGLRCSIIDQAKARQLKMGGLLAVGSGGSTPPVMIVLEYQGRASSPAQRSNQKSKIKNQKSPPILLVGKAVTFDTGGYSLKPGGGKTMKYDKCGGCAVIAAMVAAAQLKLPQRLVALVPCVENMIDSASYRVDDIVTFINGVTCEVTNTDAEGRLILADALAYGSKRYQPRIVVDLATLTGGITVALGPFCAGLFANDDKLADQFINAGQSSGDRLWRMPLWNELRDMMKGSHADLINASEKRWAHSGQGAGFLSYFVGENAPSQMPTLPWAHLDIAAVANTESDSVELAKGPTGFGVRLLIDWLRANA